MKNYTPARRRLRELGWHRRDRAIGPNESRELWLQPWDGLGFCPLGISFSSACRKVGIDGRTGLDKNKKQVKV